MASDYQTGRAVAPFEVAAFGAGDSEPKFIVTGYDPDRKQRVDVARGMMRETAELIASLLTAWGSAQKAGGLFRLVYGTGDGADGHADFKTAEARQSYGEGLETGAGLYAGDEMWYLLIPEALAEEPDDVNDKYEMQRREWARKYLETVKD